MKKIKTIKKNINIYKKYTCGIIIPKNLIKIFKKNNIPIKIIKIIKIKNNLFINYNKQNIKIILNNKEYKEIITAIKIKQFKVIPENIVIYNNIIKINLMLIKYILKKIPN